MRLRNLLAIPIVGGVVATIVYFSAFFNRNNTANQAPPTSIPTYEYIELTDEPSVEPTELH